MFDIIVGLLGGLYLGGRYIYERGREYEYEERQRIERINRYKFIKEVCDSGVQSEIKSKLADPAYADWVEAKTRDVLNLLPKRYKQYREIPPWEVEGWKWNTEEVLTYTRLHPRPAKPRIPPKWDTEENEKYRILLAKRGCVEERSVYLRPRIDEFRRENTLRKWIQEELARQGRDVVLVKRDYCNTADYMYRSSVMNPEGIVSWEELPYCSVKPLPLGMGI